jgi:molybdate transport system permease protein
VIRDALRLSLQVSLTATLGVAVVGTLLGWALARLRFRGRELLDAVITLPLVLPPTVTGYYLVRLLGRRGLLGGPLHEMTGLTVAFTWWSAVIAAALVSLPLMVRSARAAIEAVDPELEFAASTLGSGARRTFLRVTLPLARKGILAGVVLAFGRAVGEFGATLMIAGNIPGRTQTMPLAIWEAVASGEDQLAVTLVLLLTGLSVAVMLILGRMGRPRL